MKNPYLVWFVKQRTCNMIRSILSKLIFSSHRKLLRIIEYIKKNPQNLTRFEDFLAINCIKLFYKVQASSNEFR